MEKVEFTVEELSLFERIMKEEYGKRDIGLATNAEVKELPALKNLIQKLAKIISIGREQGWVFSPRNPNP